MQSRFRTTKAVLAEEGGGGDDVFMQMLVDDIGIDRGQREMRHGSSETHNPSFATPPHLILLTIFDRTPTGSSFIRQS